MSFIQKQIRNLYSVSALSSFQIAGASWVALLAARGFSLVEIGFAEAVFHVSSLLFELPSGVISDVFGRRKSMILSQCMFLVSALLMAFSQGLLSVCILGIGLGLGLSLQGSPLLMILGGFLGNLFDDLLQVRTDGLLNDRFPSSQRATLVSVSSLCFSGVMILMSPLMGWLLS